ncbi:TadE/TadG family type IV pilus assembly protein [Aliirhizobium smilacinae]|uniref:Pilus assembly protein n=1 Tax=Aliirhizobium smilacinae TaxID=1395944 RepID=A0A5C4XQ17_9HYPH|nr:TadE/TadG family type IV pilus assembly protein [Rhizobium smilacinae]TNM65408.1 pilus assembly protein [Rhizobium smilacinae]
MLAFFNVFLANGRRLGADRGGNFAIATAVMLPVLIVAGGGAVDASSAYFERSRIQGQLDAGILAAAGQSDTTKRFATAAGFLPAISNGAGENPLVVTNNSDGSVSGTYTYMAPNSFLGIVGIDSFKLVVTATAMAKTKSAGETNSAAEACIHVLGNASQAVLINSGANVKSEKCGIDVLSTSAPAFIMNAGAKIETPRFCVKGTNYIKNGGTLTNLLTGCAASGDPYAGAMPEPTLPSKCETSGVPSGTSFTLKPGMHCDVTFNGSPKVTFAPGLHIIKGRMIINSGATVSAEGVTFFFPDVYSEIRANGGLTFNASAPTTGVYGGILMFEATASASNNSNKQQYIFNGSVSETLSGIIYLPNRDVTYNSKTNQTSRINMVVNTMIMNSSNWDIEPYEGGSSSGQSGSGSGPGSVRLIN